MATNSNSNDVGVILVGHGSRLPYGKDVLSQLAEIYKKNTEYPVEIGFMNMSKPSIPTSINKLADMGVKKIVVTPVFLADGVHTTQDIPRILGLDNGNENLEHNHHHDHDHDGEEEHVHFHGEIIYTKPLGADSRIADIIKDRVDNAL
ncbi:sirohydrochlorin nickelochelatase [Methanobacterium sp. CWC-01]|jgi:sirohydrochlorin cobaltochelatase|uniref:sirohydrochlorin nickelochelatase n=1 Tax=Methanobacterium aridiramus TaxID=2584467 RepID=UPI002574D58A|nr:sirohydrochlorin nickelochelatase [Methanobacterium sp. CWC-01]WJI09578.1 sirohydrochlorin nickelochelatase [Methanobacterium sp. CWC-01]